MAEIWKWLKFSILSLAWQLAGWQLEKRRELEVELADRKMCLEVRSCQDKNSFPAPKASQHQKLPSIKCFSASKASQHQKLQHQKLHSFCFLHNATLRPAEVVRSDGNSVNFFMAIYWLLSWDVVVEILQLRWLIDSRDSILNDNSSANLNDNPITLLNANLNDNLVVFDLPNVSCVASHFLPDIANLPRSDTMWQACCPGCELSPAASLIFCELFHHALKWIICPLLVDMFNCNCPIISSQWWWQLIPLSLFWLCLMAWLSSVSAITNEKATDEWWTFHADVDDADDHHDDVDDHDHDVDDDVDDDDDSMIRWWFDDGDLLDLMPTTEDWLHPPPCTGPQKRHFDQWIVIEYI